MSQTPSSRRTDIDSVVARVARVKKGGVRARVVAETGVEIKGCRWPPNGGAGHGRSRGLGKGLSICSERGVEGASLAYGGKNG